MGVSSDIDIEEQKGGGQMGLFSAINLISGVVIGVGIFASASGALKELGSVGLTLVFWVVAGLLSMIGAFCYAELGCAMPQDGGEHNYLMKAFGAYVAFSFDWTQALLAYPLSCAAISVVVGQYFGALISLDPSKPPSEQAPVNPWVQKIIALCLIGILTLANMFSGALATKLTNVFTTIKYTALIMIAIIGWVFLAQGSTGNFQGAFEGSSTNVGKIGFGLYYLCFSYGGWNNLNYCLSDMKQPEKKLPYALVIALSIVITVYLFANITYFATLPMEVIMNTKIIATEVGYRAMGAPGAFIVPILVICCATGAVNGLIFANSKLIATFSSEGMILPKSFANLHATRRTPIRALLLTAFCTTCLVLMGDFDFLLTMYSFTTWIFFLLTSLSLHWLRHKFPNMPRPFRVWTPVAYFFTLIAAFLVFFPFTQARSFTDIVPYLVAMMFALIPCVIVFVVKARQAKAEAHIALQNSEMSKTSYFPEEF